MHDVEVSFGQACRVFWSFCWRFVIIAGVLGGLGYGALRMSMLQSPPAPKDAKAAALVAPGTMMNGPVVPTIALILCFIAGAVAMRMVMGMEFGDFILAVRSDRRDQSRTSQAERMIHSNPLSRNPQTEGLKSGPKTIIYRN